MLRILHVGLGPLGVKIVSDLTERGVGRVVAAVDTDPALAGRPLNAVADAAAPGVAVLASLDAGIGWGSIDAAVVTTSSDLRRCADTFRALLRRGLAVVSTCEELVYPRLRHPALADELDALAKAHGGRLLGTGVNPGCMMDMIPLVATAVSRSVRRIEVHRLQDAATRRIPFQKKIGATLDAAAFQAGIDAGWLRHVGLGESMHLIAHALGMTIARWEESIAPVLATRPMVCGLGPISPGDARGVRQLAHAYAADGRELIKMVFQAAIGRDEGDPEPQDRVIVDGDPPLDLTFRGGVHGDVATSSITINALPSLLLSPPGLHTMATVPLVHWRPRAEARA